MRALLMKMAMLSLGCRPATEAGAGAAHTVDSGTRDSGAPGDPAPAEPFTLLVIPDIQYLTLGSPVMLDQMMSWIVDNAESENIAMVLQEGDITHNDTVAEWEVADAAFSRLDGVVPWSLCVGNHDMAANDPGARDTTRFNETFGLDRMAGQATFLESASPDQVDDHAHVFRAGGQDWLVVSLAYDPTDAALSWAEALIEARSDHRVIVLTHAYLSPSARTAAEGRGIEERLVAPFANTTFVFNGHFTGGTAARRENEADDGHVVYEMFANYQDLLLGGAGRMRRVRVDVEAGTIDVRTCTAAGACIDDDEDEHFGYTGADLAPLPTD